MPKIGPVSRPWRGLRSHDAYGDGNFGASRSGGLRPHKGVDYICLEGDDALAPFDGLVKRVGVAYSGEWREAGVLQQPLGSIHIQGTGKYWPYYAKILYAKPDVMEGLVVKRGQKIGICQNVARYHGANFDDGGGEMHNHLHLELRVYADSQRYMEVPS